MRDLFTKYTSYVLIINFCWLFWCFPFFLVFTKKNLFKILKARSTFYMVIVVFIFLLLYFKPVACGKYGDRVDLQFS